MAGVLALVVAAGKRLTAAVLARIGAFVLRFSRAWHLALLLAAVALLHHLLGTRRALARVALRLAAMLATVKQLVADLAAEHLFLHGALHRFCAASTSTVAHHIGLARRARARVTEQSAGMATTLNSAADLATAVGQFGP